MAGNGRAGASEPYSTSRTRQQRLGDVKGIVELALLRDDPDLDRADMRSRL